MDAEGAQVMLEMMPFAKLLGIKVQRASKEEIRATLDWREELTTVGFGGYLLHGGVLMSVGDAVGALLAHFNLPPDSYTTTVESKTNFFRPVPKGMRITAICRTLSVGKTLIVVQTDIFDDTEKKRIAQVTQTQAVVAFASRM